MQNERTIKPEIYDFEIPSTEKPRRLVISTNLLVPIKKDNEFFIRMFNMEPYSWDTWYPLYFTTDTEFVFNSCTYGDLLNEVTDYIKKFSKECERKEGLIRKIHSIMGITNFNIVRIGNLIPDNYISKYSKTKNVWSIYLIEFYLLCQPQGISNFNSNIIEFCDIPLKKESLKSIVQEGSYLEKPIVENTIQILKNKTMVNELKAKAVILDF